jgi:hypothetical protein
MRCNKQEDEMARFTRETKLKAIVDDPEASAILQKWFPMDLHGSMVKMAYGMTLEKCFSFPQVELSEEVIQTIYDELGALG